MHRRPEPQPVTLSVGRINSRTEARSRGLIDETEIVLGDAEFNSFKEALESPPAPGPKLRALMRRTPAWSG